MRRFFINQYGELSEDESGDLVYYADVIEQRDGRTAEIEAELRAANRECEVRNERELGYLARAQSAEAERDALKDLLARILPLLRGHTHGGDLARIVEAALAAKGEK